MTKKYCAKCMTVVDDDHRCDDRRTSRQRGYTYRWSKTRNRILDHQPLCVDCLDAGRTCLAQEVHVPKYLGDGPTRHAIANEHNSYPLCRECHAIRTQNGE